MISIHHLCTEYCYLIVAQLHLKQTAKCKSFAATVWTDTEIVLRAPKSPRESSVRRTRDYRCSARMIIRLTARRCLCGRTRGVGNRFATAKLSHSQYCQVCALLGPQTAYYQAHRPSPPRSQCDRIVCFVLEGCGNRPPGGEGEVRLFAAVALAVVVLTAAGI
jgi:hypothetical protein